MHHIAGPSEHGKPVLRWLFRGSKAGLVVGGKNWKEIGLPSLRSTFAEWCNVQGDLLEVDDAKLQEMLSRTWEVRVLVNRMILTSLH